MSTNLYFNQKSKSEQGLYEDIIIESLQIYGQDVYYLPRDIVNQDKIFGDDVPSKFNSSYKIEMYIENPEGFDGDGDLMSKFGVEIRDTATFIVARKRWAQTVRRHDNEIDSIRPREGDLIYLTLSHGLFEITHVEHEQPFYQLSSLPTYKLRCEKFEYNDEQLNTGIGEIDTIEQTGYTLQIQLTDGADIGFIIGNQLTQTLGGVVITGEIVAYNNSTNIITVAHIGSDDDGFHMFTTGTVNSLDAIGNTLTRTVTAVGENLAQASAQNDDFGLAGANFIDFSETNPFGDPS
jgi:hypothetical protein